MSKYHSMEYGAVPGARDRPTGPKTLYHVGNSGISRACNRVEALDELARINDAMDAEIAKVKERYALRVLQVLRVQLREFNLDRHVVWISAGMGSSCVMYAERKRGAHANYVDDLRRHTPVVDRLQEIDQFVEGNWDLMQFLDKKALT